VLIYLVLRIIWTFQCHKRFSVGVYILMDIMNRHSISGNNTEQVLQSQITDLQSNIVVSGTNIAVGPNALNQVTTGTGNTAIGSDAGGSPYGIATGSGNVMVGANAGNICSGGSNNTFLGSNTDFTPGIGYYNGSIALGSGAIINNYNQLMVAPNVTAFNIAGLAASTGTGMGTILEFDSAGNVLPTVGTYKTVAAIDTAIGSINAPYAFSWYQNTTVSLDISTTSQSLALWTASYFGDSGNMASATTWTCPATGLWSFKTSFGYTSNTANIAIYLYTCNCSITPMGSRATSIGFSIQQAQGHLLSTMMIFLV